MFGVAWVALTANPSADKPELRFAASPWPETAFCFAHCARGTKRTKRPFSRSENPNFVLFIVKFIGSFACLSHEVSTDKIDTKQTSRPLKQNYKTVNENNENKSESQIFC